MHCIESLCRSLCIALLIDEYIELWMMVIIEYILLCDILILLMICFVFSIHIWVNCHLLDKCYVFTYIYATLIWLEFSPFCWNDAFMASCRLVAWRLFGRGSSSFCRSVALIRSTGSREIVVCHCVYDLWWKFGYSYFVW